MRFKRIYIEITSVCNLHCSFCQETLRPAAFLSVAQFAHILDEIKPYTNFVYLHVKGEPLLHPQFANLLEMCRNTGLSVNITTNGTLLKKQLDTLIQYPVHQINISLHSADDNDCICMDDYIPEVFACCETLAAKTDTEISLRLWNTKNNASLFGERNYAIKPRIHLNISSPFVWPDLKNVYYNDKGTCQGLRTHLAILCDGTVVPCCLDGNGICVLGNLFSDSLRNILAGARATTMLEGFRRRCAVEALCAHCSFKERFAKTDSERTSRHVSPFTTSL